MMSLQMAWKQCATERRRPPLGLKNLGNSCYLNSVLQCLTYTPPLAQFCLSSEHSSLCKKLLANKELECPFCILERQIARSLKLNGSLDAPSKVLKCLNLFAENFRWGRQEDAHEFLRYIIDSCHNTCLKLLKQRSSSCNGSPISGKGGVTTNGDLQKEEAPETTTIMNQIFGGSLLSQVKCLSCKGESNKTDDIMDISLDLFESNSLRDALRRFFKAEVLDGNNKYSCQRCKKLSVAKKQMFIFRAPNVLVIQLKRFEGAHGGKINRNIEFEEILELSNYVYKSPQESEPKYNLFGSIVHSGYSPESGHYYAYIKDAFGRWYCCNDAHVSLSSTQEVLSEKVYILFYLRSNQHQKSNKTDSPCKGAKATTSSQCGPSTCRISVGTSNLSAVKNNGLLSSDNNVLHVPNNGNVLTNSQIKPINSKICGSTSLIPNGNDKHELHTYEKNNDDKQPLVIEKAMIKSEACLDEPNCTDNLDYSSVDSKGSAISKSKGFPSLSNNIGRCRSPSNNSLESNATYNFMNGTKNPSFEHSSGRQTSTSFNKKMHGNEQVSDLASSAKRSYCLPCNGVKHSSEELNEFKQFLASEAQSDLRSCDWFGNVHDFMRARKKACTQAAGTVPNNAELKEQLINGARKNFISEIPVSLKGRLIELLKSFSQSHSLLNV